MPYITDVSTINDHRYLYISVDPEHPLKMFQYLTSLCSHEFTKYYEVPLRNCAQDAPNIAHLYHSGNKTTRLHKAHLPPEIQALLTLIGHS